MRPLWIVLLALAFPAAAKAPQQAKATPDASHASCRPDPARLQGICNDVYSRTEDNGDPENWGYAYERKIYDAACVSFEHDTSATARAKIQALWINNPERFRCDATNFRVSNGNILKYAIEMRTYPLVDNAVRAWRLDLNLVDPSDQSTLLDFVESKVAQTSEPTTRKTLRAYWSVLRNAGANRCREVRDPGLCKPVSQRPEYIEAVAEVEAFHQSEIERMQTLRSTQER